MKTAAALALLTTTPAHAADVTLADVLEREAGGVHQYISPAEAAMQLGELYGIHVEPIIELDCDYVVGIWQWQGPPPNCYSVESPKIAGSVPSEYITGSPWVPVYASWLYPNNWVGAVGGFYDGGAFGGWGGGGSSSDSHSNVEGNVYVNVWQKQKQHQVFDVDCLFCQKEDWCPPPAPVPLPASVWLLMAALAAPFGWRMKR